jgi:hypothetical protein
MKKVIVYLLVILVILLAIYFVGSGLLSRLTRDLPFPTRGDQVRVEITRADIPKHITITNSSKVKVKVYVYNADDPVRLAARKEWVLNPGRSAQYPRDNYRFRVVDPGVPPFEKILAESGIVGSDVEITGDNKKHIKISGHRKKNVTFTNKTSENLKICVYNREDWLRAIALTCWVIDQDRTVEWANAPPEFNLKVFRPQLLDKPLSTQTNVLDQSDIVIKSRGFWDRIKSLFS